MTLEVFLTQAVDASARSLSGFLTMTAKAGTLFFARQGDDTDQLSFPVTR